MHDTPRLDSN